MGVRFPAAPPAIPLGLKQLNKLKVESTMAPGGGIVALAAQGARPRAIWVLLALTGITNYALGLESRA